MTVDLPGGFVVGDDYVPTTDEDECPEGSCPECSIVFAAAKIARDEP